MSCINTTDVTFQGTLFYTKYLFSVQDSSALLLNMNMLKEIHSLLGLTINAWKHGVLS